MPATGQRAVLPRTESSMLSRQERKECKEWKECNECNVVVFWGSSSRHLLTNTCDRWNCQTPEAGDSPRLFGFVLWNATAWHEMGLDELHSNAGSGDFPTQLFIQPANASVAAMGYKSHFRSLGFGWWLGDGKVPWRLKIFNCQEACGAWIWENRELVGCWGYPWFKQSPIGGAI